MIKLRRLRRLSTKWAGQGRMQPRVEWLEDRAVPSAMELIEAPWATAENTAATAVVDSPVVIPGQWIVQFQGGDGAPDQQVAAIQERVEALGAGLQVERHLGASGLVLLSGPAEMSFDILAGHLYSLGNAVHAQPDYLIGAGGIPNDTRFPEMWGLHNTGQIIGGQPGIPDADIDAPEAWDLTTGSSSIIVAVVDSGLAYDHPDLAANVYINTGEIPGNNVDDDGNGFTDDVRGWDFFANDSDPRDEHGHGTHVAGTIAAVGNNAMGVIGVAPAVKVMPLRFLGPGNTGPLSAALSCLNYIAMMRDEGHNILIANNSWGGGNFAPIETAIAGLRDRGILFVAAAMNNNTNIDVSPIFPASYSLENIITVAASDNRDNKASFSNYGLTSVDLAAPGLNVLSTVPTSGATVVDPSGYAYFSGTSMATPHVSGVAALLWSLDPGATFQQVRDAILQGVDPNIAFRVDGPTPVATGGRLNALNAIQAFGLTVIDSSPADGDVVTVPPTQFRIDFSSTIDLGSVQPSDLLVNGIPSNLPPTINGLNSLTFHYSASPVTVQGSQTMSISADAIARLSDGDGNAAFSATFQFDGTPLQVIATNPPFPNGVFTLFGPMTYDVHFSEPFDPASLQSGDLVVSGIAGATVSGVTPLNGNTTARFTIGGVTTEGTLNASIAAGALTDAFGNPGNSFAASYIVDIGTVPYPVPLTAKGPAGSLIYDPSISATINFPGDVDAFVLNVDPGQTITVLVDPVGTPSLALYGGVGNGSGAAAGQLLLVNQSNASSTVLGDPVTPGGITGLVYDPSTSVFFASSILSAASALVRIDPDTGALLATVGPITDGPGGPVLSIGDLAIQPGTNTLYGATSNSGGPNGGRLYTINKITGVATFIGNTGSGAGGGISFAPDGSLYQTAFNNGFDFTSLNRIDPATGARLSTVPLPGIYFDGLAIRPTDGAFFAAQGGSGAAIYTINPNTGAVTFVGNTSSSTSDLAFRQTTALAPTVELRGPTNALLASNSAAAGQNALLQTVPANLGGPYTIRVGGAAGSTGGYSVQVILNAAVELEGTVAGETNDSLATAQDINGSFINLHPGVSTAQRGAVAGSISASAATTNLIANGGFESGNFSGWTVTGSWQINNGTVDPTSPSGPLAPISGAFDALTNMSGPGTHTMTQSFLVPTSVGQATLGWLDRIQNHFSSYLDPTQEFRVEILDSVGNLVQTVFSTNPGDALIQIGPNNRSFDVSSLLQSRAGQTLLLRFTVQAQSFFLNATVDDVSLNVTSAPTNNLISNGGFETGNFSGWNVVPGTGLNGWQLNNGSVDPASPAGPQAPISGAFDVFTDPTGPAVRSLTQSFVVPTTVTQATLSWSDRIQNLANAFQDPNQEFRVQLLDSSGNLLQTVFSTNPGDPLIQNGPNHRSFDVTALLQSRAGQTLQLRFEEQDSLFYFNVTLDNISLNVMGPSTSSGGDLYSFNLAAGEKGTLALDTLTGSGANVELLNSGGTVIATGVAGPTNYDRVIHFTAPAAGPYFARVTSTLTATYNLVVTRSAVFDTEDNNSFATAQSIDGTRGVLGHAKSGGTGPSTLVLNAFDSGWWDSTGFHSSTNTNYVVGQNNPSQLARNFFVFDLSNVTQPISSAQLNLFNPVNGYVSPDPTETYAVYDVSTSISALRAGGSGQVAIYNDLGSGVSFGTQTVSAANNNQNIPVVLNADGVAALNAARGSQFAVGGALTTIAGTATQFVFAFTNGSLPRQLVLNFDAPDDWYSINVTSTAHALRLETRTPADGPGEFVNTFNPRIELYNPAGTLVAVGSTLADGRNEFIQYLPPVSGNYRIRVIGQSNTQGEYFLGANFLPRAVNDSATTAEDNSVAISVLSNDSDIDGTLNPATVAVVSGPGNGSVSVSPVGVVTYTPSANFFGTDSFTYTVRDNNGGISNVATVTVLVREVNDVPTANPDNATTPEDTSVIIDVLANDSKGPANESGQILTVISATALNGSVVINADNTLTYTPNANYHGPDTISYTIRDNGTTNGVADPKQSSSTVAVTVLSVNDAPVADDDFATTNEDTPVSGNVLANDSDPNDNPANILSASLIAGPANGTLVFNTDGSYTYTPPANFFGTDTFTYQVSDDGGTANGGDDTGNIATVTITVNEVNDNPVAVGDSYAVDEDSSLSGNVLDNDRDPDNTDGIPGNEDDLDVVLMSGPHHGLLELDPETGAFTYTPGVGCEADSDSFTYKVMDSRGGESALVTVNITINKFSGVALGADGVLRVGGTDEVDVVTVSGGSLIVNGTPHSLADVTEIRIWVRGANDRVDLSGTNIRSYIHGGDGHDVLVGGGGSDVMLGGDGDDNITGAAGDDVLVGGNGSDRLVGAAGNDILVAGDVDCAMTYEALLLALAEWVADKSYDPNGNEPLDDGLITDQSGDQLTGGAGADLYFISLGDKITDINGNKKDGDQVVYV